MTPALLDPPAARTAPPPRRARRPAEPDPPAAAPQPAAPARSAPIHLPEFDLTIPGGLNTLADFNAWARSDDFPEHGRISWIGDRIEVELMSEAIHTHGGPKTEFARVFSNRVFDGDLGQLYIDGARVVSPEDSPARVSNEPDLVLLTHDTIESGRVTFTPKKDRPGDAIDVVGPPDLVVEVLSDSSVGKDTIRLPRELFLLGVTEYWLADCRGEAAGFQIHARGDDGFEPVTADADGFATSAVLGRAYRLTRDLGRSGLPRFRLHERA